MPAHPTVVIEHRLGSVQLLLYPPLDIFMRPNDLFDVKVLFLVLSFRYGEIHT